MLLLLDYRLPDMTGKQILDLLTQRRRRVPFTIITGRGDEKIAVEMMKLGAVDYIVKDSTFLDLLPRRIKRACREIEQARRLVQAEEALQRSEQQLHTLMDNLPGVAYRCRNDQDWRMEFISRGCRRLTGYPSDALEIDGSIAFATIIHPKDRSMVWETVQNAVRKNRPFQVEYRIRTADGRLKWVWEQGRSVSAEPGDQAILEGLIVDISKQKKAEQKLSDSLKKLRTAQQRLQQQALWMKALNSVSSEIARRNSLDSVLQVMMHYLEDSFPFALGAMGLLEQKGESCSIAILSRRGRSLAHRLRIKKGTRLPQDGTLQVADTELNKAITFRMQDIDPVAEAEPARGLIVRLRQEGIRAIVIIPLAAEKARTGALYMFYKEDVALSKPELGFLGGMAEYVSLALRNHSLYQAVESSYNQLKTTQEVMKQQERMKAMGQMASGIAHDINNTLAPITLYTEALLNSKLGQDETAQRYLSTIQSAVGDLENTTLRLRSFYKREEDSKFRLLDIEEVFDSATELARPRWKDIPNRRGVTVNINKDVAKKLPSMTGIESEIREALVNLIFNAVDAMPNGGTVTLSALKRGPRLVVEVTDTGVGMTEEQRRRCLEPFFTSKGTEGSGLGLSIAYGIVQRHKGEIEIQSESGEGTTVRLLFPLPVKVKGIAPATEESEPAPLPSLRLLCVDDDERVRGVLKEILSAEGHEVQACAGGEEALEAFQDASDGGSGYDLVITDLGMPHMDGRELARRIKQLSPRTPVILLSGWGNFMNLDEDLPENIDCLLGKPPKMKMLQAAIRSLVDQEGGPG